MFAAKKTISVFHVVLLIAASFASNAMSDTVDIVATVDGDVQFFGGLSVGNGTTVNTTRSGGLERRGLFEFDLSTIADGSTIQSATFLGNHTTVTNTSSMAVVTYFGYTGNGLIDLDGSDFSNGIAQVAQQDFVAPNLADTEFSVVFDDVSALQNALDNASSDFFGLRSETHSFVTFAVHSLETGTAGVTLPTLRIEFTSIPEPTGFWMVLTALGFIGGRRAVRPT